MVPRILSEKFKNGRNGSSKNGDARVEFTEEELRSLKSYFATLLDPKKKIETRILTEGNIKGLERGKIERKNIWNNFVNAGAGLAGFGTLDDQQKENLVKGIQLILDVAKAYEKWSNEVGAELEEINKRSTGDLKKDLKEMNNYKSKYTKWELNGIFVEEIAPLGRLISEVKTGIPETVLEKASNHKNNNHGRGFLSLSF